MAESAEGRIIDASDNGDLKISLPPGQAAEIGQRFSVLNDDAQPIAEIKVVRVEPSEVVARYFPPFVPDETLRASTGAPAGTAVGAVLGTMFFPGAGTVIGGALGAAVGGALEARPPSQPIRPGMAIVRPGSSGEDQLA